ncbi:MAG TPA: methionyl-tRNA formyltransferase [Blastocatellia bacterium]|nr:methionyl-tRNA formyltransferase [Blastocatellia bacterium]
MKLIFMGTPEFAVPTLARLLDDGHEVAAVFTQPDKPAGRGKHLQPPPVKAFARERGIPVYQPAKIKTNEEVRAIFEQAAPDACIVAAYGKILPEWLLRIPRLGCINVHASLLPKYRGAAPINWAIANGERETGITIMQMDVGMDTGPMLARRATPIGPEETAPELTGRLAAIGAELLSEALPKIASGEIIPTPQDDAQATYAPILKREDGMIDWGMTAREIACRVRAFQPWPATWTMLRGARFIIWRAHEAEGTGGGQAEPATIISLDQSGFTIACAAATALRVEEAQIEGKRRLPAREIVNGLRLKVGDRIADSTS